MITATSEHSMEYRMDGNRPPSDAKLLYGEMSISDVSLELIRITATLMTQVTLMDRDKNRDQAREIWRKMLTHTTNEAEFMLFTIDQRIREI